MANNPKKAKDPTEVALSAIQEALNISESSADSNRNTETADLPPSPVMPSAPPSFEQAFEPRTSATDRPMFEPIEEPQPRVSRTMDATSSICSSISNINWRSADHRRKLPQRKS